MHRSKPHFLQKLYSREVNGSFVQSRKIVHDKAEQLFSSIPDRLMFCLRDVLPQMRNHILVGTTRCGQFLITYSYATDHRPDKMMYKYRLHWWAFRPGTAAYKVAEVQLFDNQDVFYSLTVGIAQWPNVNDKLIVYGYCHDCEAFLDQEVEEESHSYYITVTTLPSLHDCRDCKVVAESFDEEDLAANWDSCIGLSCLKHGLTIHTTLEIAPPYPSFDLITSLKIDNKIIVNTGSFLHVLSFESDKEAVKPSHNDSITPADIHHSIGERLTNVSGYICPWKTTNSKSICLSKQRSLTRSINKAWLNTIMDRAEKVYEFEEAEDGCETRFKWFRKRRIADKMYEFCSDDEDMENVQPRAKISRVVYHTNPTKEKNIDIVKLKKNEKKDEISDDDDEDYWMSPNVIRNTLNPKDNIRFPDSPKYFINSIKAKKLEVELEKRRLEMQCKMAVPCNSRSSVSGSSVCELSAEPVVRRMEAETPRAAGHVPNFSCDHCVSKDCDIEMNLSLEGRNSQCCETSHQSMSGVQELVDCDNLNSVLAKDQYKIPVDSSTNVVELTPSKAESHPSLPLDISIINPDLSAILAEWEADSVSSLSPKSDSFLCRNGETKEDVIQSFLELIPGMTLSPRTSSSSIRVSEGLHPEPGESNGYRLNEVPHSSSRLSSPNSSTSKYSPLLVVLRARNCNQEKEPQKKEPEDKQKGSNKDDVMKVKPLKENDTVMRQRMISGCSVQFDRIYIEVDEEIMSTITDIEDDDQGTGFHCALPLSVHGSAYAQLQMVSSHKAEKMNIHCERVFQTSLDIEQFLQKAAEIICKCEGFKFWFCGDYDVEIVDVCAFNSDILCLVCLRLNAEKKSPINERHSVLNQRYFYEVRCVFIWNPVTDRCWLEAYSDLVDVTRRMHTPLASAKLEAVKLRCLLQPSTLFSLQSHPPVRTFEHRMFNSDNILVPSLEEIRDPTNLIGFKLLRNHISRRRTVDSI